MQDARSYAAQPMDLMRENQFWLRIFRDHSQFMMETLAPCETNLFMQAQQFFQVFDQLLQRANAGEEVCREAAQAVMQFRCLKLNISDRQLASEIPINLPPGALNEMLDEDDYYCS